MCGSSPQRLACLFIALLGKHCARAATVFSASLDAEIVDLHAQTEERWRRMATLTQQLRSAATTSVSLPAGADAMPGSTLQVSEPSAGAVSQAVQQQLRAVEADFQSVQQQAFRIGRESPDNTALSQHPNVNEYLQDLRALTAKMKDAVQDLEKEYKRVTGHKPEKPKKKPRQQKTVGGVSEAAIRETVRSERQRDDRAFRARAMDIGAMFRERQLQMADKQRDLQLTMEGPDWPKEDWPLTSQDAKLVGDAEALITSGLQELNRQLEPHGGLAQLHESEDEAALEQLSVLGEIMNRYGELIDQHVATVKKASKGKAKKGKRRSSAGASQAGGGSSDTDSGAAAPAGGASLRTQLLNFGGQASQDQPFAWLRGDGAGAGSSGAAPSKASPLGTTSGRGPDAFGRVELGSLAAARTTAAASPSAGAAPSGGAAFAQGPALSAGAFAPPRAEGIGATAMAGGSKWSAAVPVYGQEL